MKTEKNKRQSDRAARVPLRGSAATAAVFIGLPARFPFQITAPSASSSSDTPIRRPNHHCASAARSNRALRFFPNALGFSVLRVNMQSTSNQGFVDKPASARIPMPVMPESVLRFFRANGRLGGLAKSQAKTNAARENGRLGGRPHKQGAATLPMSAVLAAINRASTKGAAD
jgi:hypothetical protein